MRKLFILVAPVVLLAGCAHFEETYHFAGRDARTGAAVNYYRVEVKGRAAFSRARYIAGYYDERAIDLFFNEIKSSSGQEDEIPKIFEPDQKAPGTDELIKPLGQQDGTLMIIFSTNAKAVADTIGEFAESQVAADAITNLVNRREITRLKGEVRVAEQAVAPGAAAATEELTGLVTDLSQGAAPDMAAGQKQCVRILERIAQEFGAYKSFSDLSDAHEWFNEFISTRRSR